MTGVQTCALPISSAKTVWVATSATPSEHTAAIIKGDAATNGSGDDPSKGRARPAVDSDDDETVFGWRRSSAPTIADDVRDLIFQSRHLLHSCFFQLVRQLFNSGRGAWSRNLGCGSRE